MKAIRIHEFGPTEEVLQYETDVPVPEPGEGEVQIKVEAASLNRADLGFRRGTGRAPTDLPLIPGRELAGTVTKVGLGVQGFQAGQRVVAHPGIGGYAEYAVCKAVYTRPVPEGVDPAKAAAMPTTVLTAHFALRDGAKLGKDERVLIQAGSSGVGTVGIQIARHMGARVITTAGSDEKCRRLHDMGADETINYEKTGFVQEVMRVTGGRGVDVVFEMVGGDVYTKSLQCLAPGGRLVSIGGAGGPVPDPPPALDGGRTASRFSITTYLNNNPAAFAELDQFLELVNNGQMQIVIGRTFPLSEARAAQKHLEGRDHFGKVVLVP